MFINNLSTLNIHELTQEQFDREFENGNIDENAIYLTPDTDSTSTKIKFKIWGEND